MAFTQTSIDPPCPNDMVLVSGNFCPNAIETCIEWLDPPSFGDVRRCKRFGPSKCFGSTVPMQFCIDRDEHGAQLPDARVSFAQAALVCAAEGKRMCRESEWTFACEGSQILPYPTGHVRPSAACNIDRPGRAGDDLRKSAGETALCTSPFGARNMVGNVDEWAVRDLTPGPYRSALKGGWWIAARNRCRPATVGHYELYADFQTGFRCCR